MTVSTERQLSHEDNELQASLEQDISNLEQRLCPTAPERLLLASKFIDYPFFATCLIGGDEHPERYFGTRHWRNYLAAYELTSRYTGPLTPDFISEIHEQFARDDPRLSKIDSTIGWSVGFSDLATYAKITPKAVAAVEANPYLEFLHVSPDVGSKDIISSDALKQSGMEDEFFKARLREFGLVVDSHGDQLILSYLAKSPEQKREGMNTICEEYNTRNKGVAERAARMQHGLISVHPYLIDYNGRTTRMVMDWALRRNGAPSTLLQDYNDVYHSPEGWAARVASGCQLYRECEARVEEGETELGITFGLEAEQRIFANLRWEEQAKWAETLVQRSDIDYEYDLKVATQLMARLRMSAPLGMRAAGDQISL